ncbi:hypothetical protein BHE74_00021058 [Ensete ventricosum]|uniref:Uncharacterized protein n=1 Tax=Ensete ventricosum TaxID=4639 RepID=A0A444EDZ8_ENSVE|nr:hypothetical protein GW17_00028005 [Ensete ventricosum]RWW71212.1 hypothetical protein BHE74_00021058 [Ensete ventricosum]RZR70911.1 hypothetical protein BHM03_00002154 [Ensete ventricosum]
MDDTIDARFKAFEAHIENRLQELFSEFKRNLSENRNKSQHDKSSTLKWNRSENIKKGDQEQDTRYPRMKVEFLRWEDGDPTHWISGAEKLFHSYFMIESDRTLTGSGPHLCHD